MSRLVTYYCPGCETDLEVRIWVSQASGDHIRREDSTPASVDVEPAQCPNCGRDINGTDTV